MARVYVSPEDSSLKTDENNNSFRSASLNEPKPQSRPFLASLFMICEPSLRPKYLEFQHEQVNYFSILLLVMYSCVTIYRSQQIYAGHPCPLSLVNLFVSIILVVFVALISNVLRLLRSFTKFRNRISLHLLSGLDTCWHFAFNAWFSLTVALSVYHGPCSANREIFGCNRSADRLDNDKIVCALMFPVITYLIIRSAKWEMVLLSYFMNIAVLLICIFAFHMNASLSTVFYVLPLTTLALYEYQRQNYSVFTLSIKQEEMQEENDRLAEEAHSTELRHMIGNVAHDLKTPLSAFVCGVDIIKSIAEEIQTILVTQEPVNRGVLREHIHSILENAVNVINTNSFMLMTINRCIDYTKASKNMKLVPMKDTINLQETIDLPLQCVKDLQTEKICVIGNPLPKNITKCVITDKLWLQENLLCLMTNAVKYSTVGNVTLSVCLSTPMRRKVSQPTLMYDTYEINDSTYQLELFSNCDDDRTALDSNSGAMVLRFEVEDTGIGLSDEAMATLFKPAKQAERLASGTGLGLFSLARRMEALGGMYGVQKRRDGKRGSLFWFEIPYRPVVEPPPTLYESLASVKSGTSEEEDGLVDSAEEREPLRLNILVVDDCVFILKTCKQMFRRAGHLVFTAENGAEALKMIKDNKNGPNKEVFDVVLMDLQMPIMDGLQATVELRKYEEQYCSSPHQLVSGSAAKYADMDMMNAKDTSHLLVIGVSNAADKDTIKEAFIAGVDAFIPKPFNLKAFSEVYASLISRPAGY